MDIMYFEHFTNSSVNMFTNFQFLVLIYSENVTNLFICSLNQRKYNFGILISCMGAFSKVKWGKMAEIYPSPKTKAQKVVEKLSMSAFLWFRLQTLQNLPNKL